MKEQNDILVTGGAGFIGAHLIKRLVKDGHRVVSLDDYSVGKKTNHVEGAIYYEMDINDIEKIGEKHSICAVFHLGNYSRIAPSYTENDKVWGTNLIGTYRVAEFCRKRNIKLIYAGSSTRFSSEGIEHSPYSFTKGMSVEIIKNYAKWYNLKYSICYLYNVFGPGYDSTPVPGYESVISVFEKQWKDGKSLTICGDGQQKRSFTYVEDVVDGFVKSWEYSENMEFQLNSQRQYTILEIAKMFSENICFIPERKGDRKESTSTNDNHIKFLDWKNSLTVEQWINQIKSSHNVNTMIKVEDTFRTIPEWPHTQVGSEVMINEGDVVDLGCLGWDWSGFFIGKKRVIGADPFCEEIEGAELYKGVVGPYDGNTRILYDGLCSSIISGKGHEVEMLSWKSFCQTFSIDKISILKINIEGGEYGLLNTMDSEDFLKIDQIAVSFHDWTNPLWEKQTLSTINLLEKNGFLVEKLECEWGWYLARKKPLENPK